MTRGRSGHAAIVDEHATEARRTRLTAPPTTHTCSLRPVSPSQPTYAYLFNQQKLGDETWRVDGINNASLPCADNGGDLDAGMVYTKYDWSAYHFESPIVGHMGQDPATGEVFGAWWTPLAGPSHKTACGGFGVGPNRQDLIIHQDAITLVSGWQ